MQILTDRASDLSARQLEGMNVTFVPMYLTLDGKTYSSGEDLSSEQFYELLKTTDGYPTTSQPSAGIFADLYRKLAQTDPEILSIHISAGLSGTMNSARAGAEMVPEAKVTFWDTKTLSCPEAWQVEVASCAMKAGWPLDKIFTRLQEIGKRSEGIYTLDTMRYLIHGGRISHLKGLLASVLKIHPVIAVSKEEGKYYTVGQERTMKKALQKIADVVAGWFPNGETLRVQLLHGNNPEGLQVLGDVMKSRFDIRWTPTATVGPILGAHTGGGLIGISVGPANLFADVPGVVME